MFPGCWVLLLGLGCVTGRSGVNIVHVFTLGQGVRVTFGGDHPHPSPLPSKGEGTGPRRGFLAGPRNDRGEWPRLGVRITATDWRCWASPPARSFDSAQDERPRLEMDSRLGARQRRILPRRTFRLQHLRPALGGRNDPPKADRLPSGGVEVGRTGVGVRRGSASRSHPLCGRLPCSLRRIACSTAPCRGRTACLLTGPA